jgi:hypothetical protein
LASAATIGRVHLCVGYVRWSMFLPARFVRKCLAARHKLPLRQSLLQCKIVDNNQNLIRFFGPKVV